MPTLERPGLYIGEPHLVPPEISHWRFVRISSVANVIHAPRNSDVVIRYAPLNLDAPRGVIAVLTSTSFEYMTFEALINSLKESQAGGGEIPIYDYFVSAGWARDLVDASNAGYFLTQLSKEYYVEGDPQPENWLKVTPVADDPSMFWVVRGFKAAR